MRFANWLIICFLLFISEVVFAQNNTSSPYSMYGFGELRTQSNPHNTAMGNVGIGMASENFLNTLNPASYFTLDSTTFLLEIGVDGKISSYQTKTKTAKSNDANFSYLALGWRINKWLAAGMGLNPFSSTGYEINTISMIEGIQQEYPLDIIGSGDISRAYVSMSLSPVKNLAFGVKSSYLFGFQLQTQFHDLTGLGSNSIYNETTDHYSNFYWEFGLQYRFQLNKKNKLTVGAIYNPRQTLNTRRVNTTYNSAGSTLQYEEESTGKVVIPEEIGLGFSWQKGPHLLLAADAGIQNWSDETYKLSGVNLKNNPYLNGGIDFLPSTNLFDAYYKKISYRFGFRYAKSYLELREVQLDETAVSFGLGLPIRNQKSRVDLSFEFGTMGTTNKSLIREDYFRLRLGFSLKDSWFGKPKYN